MPPGNTRQDGGMTAPGTGSEHPQQVIIVGPDGRPVGTMPMPQPGSPADGGDGQDAAMSVNGMVEEPAKVMRIGTMIKQLLEEVRAAPLDEASRNRLRGIHAPAVRELGGGVSPRPPEEREGGTPPVSGGG